MDNYILVRPEHLNHYSFLFGGYLLKWVDEFSWLCATRDYPGSSLVTVGLDQVVFKATLFLDEEERRFFLFTPSCYNSLAA